MSRTTLSVITATVVACAAMLLTAPSYAAASTSDPDGQMPPCPLTEEQYKQGKKIVAQAVAEVVYGREVLDTNPLGATTTRQARLRPRHDWDRQSGTL